MEKIKTKQLGTLNLFGSRYAVITSTNDTPQKPLSASVLKVENNVPSYLVAKEFFVEHVHEGITMGDRVFVTPHWISIGGDFVIEWLPAPAEIEILLPVAGELVNE